MSAPTPRPIDYDDTQYRAYAQGRALSAAQRALWAEVFARHLPPERPLRGLDLGSGTGRFTGLLADEFGGPVTGVEPSVRMREQAPPHPRAAYVPGRAEELPLPDAAVDFALAFLVWHHVRDKEAGARELLRVVRPGGTFLLRTTLADRLPRVWWIESFPNGPEAHAAYYQPLADVRRTFEDAGWTYDTVDELPEPYERTRAEMLERLRTGAFSVLEQLSEEDRAAGYAELERRVREDPGALVPAPTVSLVVFRR